MDKIVPKFQASLFTGISNTLPDIAELGIDSILNDGAIKDIPIVSVLLGIKDTAQSLHYRNLLRQTLAFISELNNGNIDEKKKQKYKKKIEDSPKKAEAELGRVLIILNQTIELDKSKILASIFRAYVNEKIGWETFCEFSEITRMFFISDFYDLKRAYYHDTEALRSYSYGIDRLAALGLVKITTNPEIINGELGSRRDMELSRIGGLYYSLVAEVLS